MGPKLGSDPNVEFSTFFLTGSLIDFCFFHLQLSVRVIIRITGKKEDKLLNALELSTVVVKF